jgi:hypothetical protein
VKDVNERAHRFSELSSPRQTLVRLCQMLNFGKIGCLHVVDADPVLNPSLLVLVDIRLDSDGEPRPEVHLKDFELCDEVRRLMARLDELKNGVIERVEVRAGVPRRIVVQSRLCDAQR